LPPPLHTLTAAELARRIRARDLSPVAVLQAHLQRIQDVEPQIRAWVHIDDHGALDAARGLEAEARAGSIRGPLHGVPVGLKDIYHVAGMVTTSGASGFAHERPQEDAVAVASLRHAGAVILGKTTTTEFAYLDPTVTRNPWNLEHTPGGSSSGSAAAVAARMIPFALGSQTVGSTLRPAAYCGVVGLKPTYARISTVGVTPLASSLDHVGVFARSVDDAALIFSVLAGVGAAASEPVNPPRLGLLRAFFHDRAAPEVAANVETAVQAFRRAGARIDDVTLPDSGTAIHDAGQLIMRAEAAAFHAERYRARADAYRPRIRELIEAGLKVKASDYVAAQQARQRFRQDVERILEGVDALLLPVAPAAAPKGLTSTGDPYFCAPWSYAGLPAIALPSGKTQDGLPLSIQLVGGSLAEERLLRVARWCERALNFTSTPP